MLTRFRRQLLLVTLLFAASVLPGTSAGAAEGKVVCDDSGTVCDVRSESDGAGGNDGSDTDPVANGQTSTGLPSCTATTDYGLEFEGYFAGRAPQQPPANDPIWGSHEAGDGAIYICETHVSGIGTGVDTITGLYWAPEAPDAEPPDPEVLAQEAIDKLEFDLPQIATTLSDPDDIGYVGLPVWLWIGNPGPSTLGPLTASAAAGGNEEWRVTVEARLDRFEWDMGDGTTVTCHGPGTPYQESFGDREPECGHVYTEQGDPYTITLRAYYGITWSGIGEQGVIDHELPAQTAQIRVGELQVLSQ